MISVFQQCKRPEINLYLQDDIKALVDKMDTNGLRNTVCDFMLTSNHPKVKIFKERYERLDGSNLPWIELWGAGRKGMRNSTVWADQNFMQATAWLLGVDIKILNSVCINGMINYLSYSGNLEEENVPSIVPPMTIGYRTNCHFQSLLPLEVNDGGAAQIREMNERNLEIQNKNEGIVVSDDEKEKNQKQAVNKKVKPFEFDNVLGISDDENEGKMKDTSFDIEYNSEEDKRIKSFKRNVVIINEDENQFLGKKEKEDEVKKPRIENILSNIEEVKDILSKEKINEKKGENSAKLERTYSDESMSSIKSCSSIISVQSNGSDFININDLFPKPFAVKGNMKLKTFGQTFFLKLFIFQARESKRKRNLKASKMVLILHNVLFVKRQI